MIKNQKKIDKKYKFGLILILTLFSILLLIIFSFDLYFNWRYEDKILPNIKIGDITVGGMDKNKALQKIRQQTELISMAGFTFIQQNEKITIHNNLLSIDDPDINTTLVEFDPLASVNAALAIGHDSTSLNRLWQAARIILTGYTLPASYELNMAEIKNIVERDMSHLVTYPKNASLEITNNAFVIKPEITGQTIDWLDAENKLRQQLSNLQTVSVSLNLINKEADINYAEASSITQRVADLIAQKPNITLKWENKNWTLDWSTFSPWLNFINFNNTIALGLDDIKLEEYLTTEVASQINQPAQNAKFKIQNGRVVEFQGSRDGQIVNLAESIKKINENFINNNFETNIIVSPEKAKVSTKEINDLGITEIIGVGKSNFAGSPPNRRHNIKVGANALNGLIIKPGEEFSLISALGKIDAQNGYLPELVIKGNKTVPEYGGGLCQIGTTTFRATLATGLPILERRNHSYRVSYYEPAGTDATIYDPKPDYRFLNDTNNHILIQTRIEGDDLIFEFWGTKDGRQVEQTQPKIYNITAPPPTTFIETTDLPVGQKKCTESAHAGADAEFTYTVTYPNGETKQEIFKSHYRPWGAVCLIGVEKISTPEIDQATATNTETVIN